VFLRIRSLSACNNRYLSMLFGRYQQTRDQRCHREGIWKSEAPHNMPKSRLLKDVVASMPPSQPILTHLNAAHRIVAAYLDLPHRCSQPEFRCRQVTRTCPR